MKNTALRQFIPTKNTPTKYTRFAACSFGDSIYFFCGQLVYNFSNTIFKYTPHQAKWTKLPITTSAPSPRCDCSIEVFGDCAILFGGFSDCFGEQVFNDLWEYHFPSNQWTKVIQGGVIPYPRQLHSTAMNGNMMILFGGFYKTPKDDFYEYNCRTGRWCVIRGTGDVPCARYSAPMAVYHNELYLGSGHSDPYAPKCFELHRFDFFSEKWTLIFRSELDNVIQSLTPKAHLINGSLLFTGYQTNDYQEVVYTFDLGVKVWKKIILFNSNDTVNSRKRETSTVAYKDSVFFVGYDTGVYEMKETPKVLPFLWHNLCTMRFGDVDFIMCQRDREQMKNFVYWDFIVGGRTQEIGIASF